MGRRRQDTISHPLLPRTETMFFSFFLAVWFLMIFLFFLDFFYKGATEGARPGNGECAIGDWLCCVGQ